MPAYVTTATGTALNCKTMLPKKYLEKNPSDILHVRDLATAREIARDIRKLLWGDSMLPLAGSGPTITYNVPNPYPAVVAPIAGVDEILFTTLGNPSHVFHYRPVARNGTAIIVHDGHANRFGRDGLLTLVNALLEEGYDVFAMQMPAYGRNGDRATRGNHNSLVLRLQAADEQPLRPFLEPVWRVADYIESTLPGTNIGMTGLSGGGWTTHLAAAIDERIRVSIPVAGSLPVHLRTKPCLHPSEYGDLEQHYREFYDRFNYLDLYALATTDGRKQIQVLNQFDTCCFSGLKFKTYDRLIRETGQTIGGTFRVHLDSTAARHWVSTTVTSSVILPEFRSLLQKTTSTR